MVHATRYTFLLLVGSLLDLFQVTRFFFGTKETFRWLQNMCTENLRILQGPSKNFEHYLQHATAQTPSHKQQRHISGVIIRGGLAYHPGRSGLLLHVIETGQKTDGAEPHKPFSKKFSLPGRISKHDLKTSENFQRQVQYEDTPLSVSKFFKLTGLVGTS